MKYLKETWYTYCFIVTNNKVRTISIFIFLWNSLSDYLFPSKNFFQLLLSKYQYFSKKTSTWKSHAPFFKQRCIFAKLKFEPSSGWREASIHQNFLTFISYHFATMVQILKTIPSSRPKLLNLNQDYPSKKVVSLVKCL